MNVSEVIREIKRDSLVMKMVSIAFQHGTIVMYVGVMAIQVLKDKNTIRVKEYDAKAMLPMY